ncbi:MAG: FG-GAP-like repeat-containing protein [Bryobacteraceae bacterium]
MFRRLLRQVALFLVIAAPVVCQRVTLKRSHLQEYENAEFRGSAMLPASGDHGRRLAVWGDKLRIQRGPRFRLHDVEDLPSFGAGGCVADVNQDGEPDLVLHQLPLPGEKPGGLGRMVWLEGPFWESHEIDTDADFDDCLATTMFGKRGILIIHRRAQIRFYEIPEKLKGHWSYQEIYSIYTPSAQGGLLRADIDGDGNPDILAGNYWVKSPATAEAPWQLFAINKWWEKPRSAMLRLAAAKNPDTPFPVLVAAEAEADEARLAWFERPADPTQFWRENKLEALPPLRRPKALAAADLSGSLRNDIIVGENIGDGSRLLVYWNLGGGKYQGTRIDLTPGLTAIYPVDFDGDGDLDLLGVGPRVVGLWKNQRLK